MKGGPTTPPLPLGQGKSGTVEPLEGNFYSCATNTSVFVSSVCQLIEQHH